MQLNKINGNTFYIDAPTNIGVFQFKDKYTLLIDSGNNNQQAAKIDRILCDQNLKVKFILNTHNHIDHSGGNVYFKDHYPGSIICSSSEEALFMENDFLFPMYLFGANPIKELSRHFVRPRKIAVDVRIEEGSNKINDEKFEVFYLKGHAKGQIGIATRDRVCFLGDGIFSEEILEKYPFPFLLNINDQLETLDFLNTLDYDFFVLSHGKKILGREELSRLVEMNRKNINDLSEQIIQLLDQPHTRESILEEITILNDLELDFKEYHFSLSTVGAFLTFLDERNLIDYRVEEGKLYFFVK